MKLLMLEDSLMSWNCRGAGSREFLHEVSEMMREHKSSIIVLIEPRISRDVADAICKKLGKKM